MTEIKQDGEIQTIYLPIKVLPVPGGPNKRRPFGGPLNPVNISLQKKSQLHLSNNHQETDAGQLIL